MEVWFEQVLVSNVLTPSQIIRAKAVQEHQALLLIPTLSLSLA